MIKYFKFHESVKNTPKNNIDHLYKPRTQNEALPNCISQSAVILARFKISPSFAACRIWPWIPFFFSLGQSLLAMYVITKLASWRMAKAAIPYLQSVILSDLLINLQILVKQANRKKLVKWKRWLIKDSIKIALFKSF